MNLKKRLWPLREGELYLIIISHNLENLCRKILERKVNMMNLNHNIHIRDHKLKQSLLNLRIWMKNLSKHLRLEMFLILVNQKMKKIQVKKKSRQIRLLLRIREIRKPLLPKILQKIKKILLLKSLIKKIPLLQKSQEREFVHKFKTMKNFLLDLIAIRKESLKEKMIQVG